MTTPQQPATEAGRALLDTLWREWHPDPPYRAELSILAIEAEAAAGLLALREALKRCIRVEARMEDWRHAEAVLADTAPAAAEIEARIRAEAWAEFSETYPNTVDLNIRARTAIANAVNDWLASAEAEQRVLRGLRSVGIHQDEATKLAAILAELRREQPATEEAGE